MLLNLCNTKLNELALCGNTPVRSLFHELATAWWVKEVKAVVSNCSTRCCEFNLLNKSINTSKLQ